MKKVITYIISFFLSIFILLLVMLLVLSNTLLNKQFTLNVLEKNNYYERTYADIQEGFKDYIMQSGLEESVLEELYDREKVREDVGKVIDTVYENKTLEIDTQSMEKELDDRINEVLKQNNRTPDIDEKEAIQTFEKAITDTYMSGITISKSVVEKIGEIYTKAEPIIKKAELACVVIIAVLLVIIIAINRKVKETLKFTGVSLLASGILCCLLKLFVGNRASYIVFINTTFSETLRYMINSIVNTFLIVGIISAIIGVVGIISGNWNKEKSKT